MAAFLVIAEAAPALATPAASDAPSTNNDPHPDSPDNANSNVIVSDLSLNSIKLQPHGQPGRCTYVHRSSPTKHYDVKGV
jgi:hypothetical protein